MGGYSPSSSDIDRHYRERDYYGASSYYDSGRTERVTPKRTITTAEQIFTQSGMFQNFDPAVIKLPREALDSAMSPHSRGLIFAEDVTGSMGRYLLSLIQTQFPKLIKEVLNRFSFNPHIMFMGIGDVAAGDIAPLQVTQFESDLRMLEQLEKLWLEKHGGNNPFESYILAWYFAAKYCKMDCYDKRGEKGFIFTFGDEEPTPRLTASELRTVFGDRPDLDKRTVSSTDCLEMVSEKFYPYHIILHGSNYYACEISKWRDLLDGHACDLEDYDCLPDLVCAIIDMYEGHSKTEVIEKIEDSHTRHVVRNALSYHEEHVDDVKVSGTETESKIEIF